MQKTVALAALLAAASTTISSGAFAKAECSVDAINALHVPNVQVDTATETATPQPHCAIHGTITTHGKAAPDGSARFAMQLPDNWAQRFFFMGVGGNAGTLNPSVNPTDRREALTKGYATIVQDSGHVGNGTGADWLEKPHGKRDTAKIVDFDYRAAHDATVAGKVLARAYYGAPVKHAYFDGCSTGGRMAMMEAERYPSDFDGIIGGDPAMDYYSYLLRMAVQKAALSSPAAYLSQDTLTMVDRLVTAKCDALDGATDGLVQQPLVCPVKAEDLICKAGATTECLTPEQAAVLHTYTGGLRDRHGHMLYPGWAITNLSGPRGASHWNLGDKAPDLKDPEAPWGDDPKEAPRGWVYARQAISYWLGMGPQQQMLALDIDPVTGIVGDKLLALSDKTFGPAETKDPAKMLPFIKQGRKFIFYHGTSDPAIPAARTIIFYYQLAELTHGSASKNVRLFLVPGMQHCSGGVGPDQFDTLTALENWVEQGKPPDAIPATTKPDAPLQHALPLCPYPRQARYSGQGDVAHASNWTCQ